MSKPKLKSTKTNKDGGDQVFMLGDHIWIEPVSKRDFDVALGARVIAKLEGKKIQVIDDDGQEQWLSPERRIKPMHPTSVGGVEDMIGLGDLNEAGILRNLLIRYNSNKIYTYTGSILVAVNPYQILPIYDSEQIKLYKDKKIGELSPHVFAVGDNCYNLMKRTNGESGAGKTESTKLILQYLAAISGKHSWIEQQILDSNPILEAFGNAKTVRNDNSSRFGKFIEIYFHEDGTIEGARIEQYLLEKSRIVAQNKNERNYHIFYCMLAGLSKDQKDKLHLRDASNYHYLVGGGKITCEGRDDAEEFTDIRAAMKVLEMTDQDIWDVLKILASILHMGNIKYDGGDPNEAASIPEQNNVERVAAILGVDKAQFIKALTHKSIRVQGETVTSAITGQQSRDVRDAFAKGIYGRLFIHIVKKVNAAIFKSEISGNKSSIGILDIFGFENFDHNSFEQFCINYCNENIQQFFIKYIFKMEQEEYTREGINWEKISFVDNQATLNMIAQKPMNIFALIDEQSKFPKATDQTLVQRLHQEHKGNDDYLKPKSDTSTAFGINHFAGVVLYDTRGFLEKNRDTASNDILMMLPRAKNKFLQYLFNEDLKNLGNDNNKKKIVTLASQFKKSLDLLMATLGQCNPFFVRCVKPNEFKKPKIFDRELCCRQLRYSGMLETIRIRRAGYPIRFTFKDFVDRYRFLVSGIGPSHKIDCRSASDSICDQVLLNADYQIGNTKIFLKDDQELFLEQERDKALAQKILILQKHIKGWYYRTRFLKQRKAAIIIQKCWKSYRAKRSYLIIKRGYQRMQAMLRSKVLTNRYRHIRSIIVRLQARCRGYYVRRGLRKEEEGYEEEKEIEKKATDEPVDDSKVVDDVFGYLENEDDKDVKREPSAFKDLPNKKRRKSEVMAGVPEAPVYDKDTSEYNFQKFAKTYFHGNITHQYSRRPIKHSLLNLSTNGDNAAAVALWKCILRFMGDLPEPKHYRADKDYTPMMSKISATLGRNFSKTKEFQELSKMEENGTNGTDAAPDKKLVSLTLKRQDKMGEDIKKRLLNEDESIDSYTSWLDARPTTNMEKLHFITGHGILRSELRDEIFCQICKQLTNNPSKSSHARGWILLSLCVGCFAPTERFEKYLYQFIKRGPPGYAPFCDERLRRTFMNGNRTQPPSWLELQTTKSKQPITLQVTFMDGSTRSLLVDSASTAKEMCTQLADKIGLKDRFGFSLFIALYDKVSSLGGGADHVMDALSQCEQFAKEKGVQESKAPWRLFFRKEIFSPWHEVMEDPKSTTLIYQQCVRGIKHGEYRCEKLDDLAMLIAQQYYVEHGADTKNVQISADQLQQYLPAFVITAEKPLQYWHQMVSQAFSRSYYVKEHAANIKVKEDVVNFARFKWPLLFSRFYEAVRTSGPKLPTDQLIIAVNWTGVYMVDDQEQVILELSYPEIKSISSTKSEMVFQNHVTISTIRQEDFKFSCTNAEDIRDVVNFFLDGLKERSKYAVCTKPYKSPDLSSALDKGDLVRMGLDQTGASLMRTMWCSGTNENKKKDGDFPLDSLYILPTLSKPSQNVITPFVKTDIGARDYGTVASKTLKENAHTMEKFASTYFRDVNQSSNSNRQRTIITSATNKTDNKELWRHSRDPLRLPLLKSLMDRDKEEIAQEACMIFTAILKYMGDLPSRALRTSNELTDQIFGGPLKYEILRDEVYCQIMKQLTSNRNPHSEQRGWDLLWLATGLFPCSKNLIKDLTLFQKTRKNPIAADTIGRLERTIKQGQRKFPPHQVEVEAIQHKTPEIYHKIYFPDNTEEIFMVDSSIKAKDLVKAVVQKLNLVSSSGFSIFVKIADKVISVPDNDFFFDFIRSLTDWIKKARPTRDGTVPNYSYQVFFMRKLWLNVQPGKDKNADVIFHYHQELPKYLRGWHKLGQNEVANLAALVFRAKYGKTKEMIPQVLPEILPNDIIRELKVKDWVKIIEKCYGKHSKMDHEEARIQFLKETFKLPTFGSTFFEVKQSTDQNYPELVLVAINKNGVSLIHRQTKEVLVTFPFSKISHWSSGNTYFHLTIGNLVKGSKLLCETALGYKMDDLLTSYTYSMVENINKQRTVRGIKKNMIKDDEDDEVRL